MPHSIINELLDPADVVYHPTRIGLFVDCRKMILLYMSVSKGGGVVVTRIQENTTQCRKSVEALGLRCKRSLAIFGASLISEVNTD